MDARAVLRLAAKMQNLHGISRAVAHDLRSPLNGMTLNLEILKQTLTGTEHETWLHAIEEDLGRLGELLEVWLAQTAPAGEPERFALGHSLDAVGALLRPGAKRQRVKLEVVPAPSPAWVHGQREWIEHAVLSLGLNALEALGEGGRLEIRERRDGDRAVVAVSDDGPGIAAADRDRLFDAHFTIRPPAAGIGLATAREIAEAHDGRLELVASEPGGTVFELQLPCESE